MFLATLLEPFQFDFMVNALMVSVIVAIPCALLSVFLVLKGWALMGDAMSHAVFPGSCWHILWGFPGDWRFHCRIILRYRHRLSGR